MTFRFTNSKTWNTWEMEERYQTAFSFWLLCFPSHFVSNPVSVGGGRLYWMRAYYDNGCERNASRHLLTGDGMELWVFGWRTWQDIVWILQFHQGCLTKLRWRRCCCCCYTGLFSAGPAISPLSASFYLIMLCEFWIFPPALNWNVNY